MAFRNEVVSDTDIDRYNLPFPKGGGRWWTRDAERDYYLWGGLSGNPAFDTERVGKFHLYIDSQIHLVIVIHEDALSERGHFCRHHKWVEMARVVPEPRDSYEKNKLLDVLREALRAYAFDGQDNFNSSETDTEICF